MESFDLSLSYGEIRGSYPEENYNATQLAKKLLPHLSDNKIYK